MPIQAIDGTQKIESEQLLTSHPSRSVAWSNHGTACLLERLSQAVARLVPVALFPASSEREKISFNQINKKTGNRIRYRKIDAETGDEVDSADIIKGYEVGKGQYIEIEPEELEDRYREQAHNRDRRVRPQERNRRTLSKQPVLSRS